MAKYEVVAVHRHSQQEIRLTFPDGAPSDQKIVSRLFRMRGNTDTRRVNDWLATRYYPSRKGWVIFDFQHTVPSPLRSRPSVVIWRNIHRSTRVYPSEDAAVMKIRYMAMMPEQLALIP